MIADDAPMKRKLIEVALPLERISKANRSDKDRKTGSIRNIHKWFAPMPSPAWRALLLAAIVDSPSSGEERQYLIKLIERLVPPDGAEPEDDVIQEARRLITRHAPDLTIVDPFSGGGSTLVEAARLGLPVIGTDLNPVAALITRFLVEIAPQVAESTGISERPGFGLTLDGRFAPFIRDATHYAEKIRQEAWAKLAPLYPPHALGQPIGWLWAHMVICPNPACETRVPLISSTVLLKQRGRHAYLALRVQERRVIPFIVDKSNEASKPTKAPGSKARFHCPSCSTIFGVDHIKQEADSAPLKEQLMCSIFDSPAGRVFVAPDSAVYTAGDTLAPEDSPVLEIRRGALGVRVQPYGYKNYSELFTNRQQHTLLTIAQAVAKLPAELQLEGVDEQYSTAIATFLGLCVGRMSQGMSRQVRWRIDSRSGSATAEAAFSRQILPMVWDYVETNPFGGSTGDWILQVKNATRALHRIPSPTRAKVRLADARSAASEYPKGACLVATDPPYFSAIGYADLSDYFYQWLRIALQEVHPDLFATTSAPKFGELIADPSRFDGDEKESYRYFVSGFTEVFKQLAIASNPDFPLVVIYAQKQEDTAGDEGPGTGWEALLEAMINAGLAITGTWPIHGTGSTRQRILSSNALASYIVLTCRVRGEKSGSGSRRAFISMLRSELPGAVKELQEASIAPVDLNQAAIGPGMAIFSRFERIVESDGTPMKVGTALALINQVRDEALSEQDVDLDLDSRFCLKWFAQYGWDEQPYARADDLSRSTNTSVEGLTRGGVLWARAGKARLTSPDELSAGWDPLTDDRISAWEVVLRLAKALNDKGANEASRLMSSAAQRIDLDAAKELAYLLFAVCERRKWTQSALLFNGLGTSWSDLSAAARTGGAGTPSPSQGELDFASIEE